MPNITGRVPDTTALSLYPIIFLGIRFRVGTCAGLQNPLYGSGIYIYIDRGLIEHWKHDSSMHGFNFTKYELDFGVPGFFFG